MKAVKTASMVIVCVLGSVLFFSGCSKAEESGGIYQAGTYTASAIGFGGNVTVEVEFDSDSIQSVTITEQKETEDIAGQALEKIPKQIIEAQTSEVDAVTGATFTSNAIKNAVADCIQQAAQK